LRSCQFCLLKNFTAFYGTRRFITMFTKALHWSLSWARSIQSTPSHPISLRSILILSSRLRLGLPSALFPSGFQLMSYVHPSSCYIPCPSHPPLLDHSNYDVFMMRSLIKHRDKFTLCRFPDEANVPL
jgi:hypothetical protein